MICAFDGHETDHYQGRHLCARHYRLAYRDGTIENYPTITGTLAKWNMQAPLVCLCPERPTDPGANFGECPACRRKPMALLEQSVFG